MGYIETAYNGPNELDIHDAKLRNIVSLAFSEIKAYAKDDYCLYGDTLYVFTSAHPVGPWTGTDVRATSVDEELKSRSSTDSYTKEEVDDLLEDKADVSYVDDELATKANQATTYTKTETDTLLSAKANQSTTYTKTEVDTALSGKADKATTYTKEQVDALVSAVFRYKGTKATVADLEAVTEKAVGDVWFVSADSSEYAWNGTVWEKLGPVIDLSGYLTSLTVAGITLDSTHTTITSAQLITALNIYTQTEVDTALNAKADKSTTYTKTETDTLLSAKANQSTVDALPTNATEMPLSSQDQTTVKDAIDGLGAVMTGATSSTAGVKGLVPAPEAGDERRFLRVDGSWVVVQAEGQSAGFLPIIATLAVSDWVQSGTDYVCRITNLAITSSMYVSGLSFVDEVNIPGVVTPTIDANSHQVVLTTDVQPLNAVVAYIECAVDGATVLQDVSQLTTPFVGATASADGRQGLVPKPFIADRRKLLRADGTWDDAQASEVVYGNTNVGAALSAQSDQIVTLDGYLQIKSLGCSSLDNLKSNLLNIANSLPYNRAAYIGFWNSGVTDVLTYSGNYGGTLYINYKTDNELIFTAVVSGKDGSVVSIGYNNGAWTFENLTNQIATLGNDYQITSYGYGEHITDYPGQTVKIWKNNNIVSLYANLYTDTALPQYSQILTGLPQQVTSTIGLGKDRDNNLFPIDIESNGKIITQKAIPQGAFTVSIMYIKGVNS